jgi:hypothetical protein
MSSRRLGGGLKTDSGASAPVLPPLFFSTRQVFILTTLNKLLFMVKTLSWNQTMANKFRKSFAILLYLIRQKTVGFYWNPPTYFIEFVISLQRLNPPSLAFANHSPIRFSKHNAFAISLQRNAKSKCIGRRRLGLADFNAEAKWRMQNNPLTFSAYMRHRQGKPRKAPGGLLSVGPRGGGCARSPVHLDHRRSGRVEPIDCQQQQVPMF